MSNMADIVVRKMKKEDLEIILNITRRAWGRYTLYQLLEDRHGPLWQKGASERKTNDVRGFCQNYPERVIVAEIGGKVVGYATYNISESDGIGEVGDNAVDPEHQGKGVGTVMNRWIVDYFRRLKLKIARVSTLEHDRPAQKVYEKQGFRELARTIHYSMKL